MHSELSQGALVLLESWFVNIVCSLSHFDALWWTLGGTGELHFLWRIKNNHSTFICLHEMQHDHLNVCFLLYFSASLNFDECFPVLSNFMLPVIKVDLISYPFILFHKSQLSTYYVSSSYICPGKYLLKPQGLLYANENTNVKAGKYMFTMTKVKLMMRKNKVAEEVLIFLYVHW